MWKKFAFGEKIVASVAAGLKQASYFVSSLTDFLLVEGSLVEPCECVLRRELENSPSPDVVSLEVVMMKEGGEYNEVICNGRRESRL